MSISNICAGFCNTGISPLNCSAILSRIPSSSVVHAPEFSSTDDEKSQEIKILRRKMMKVHLTFNLKKSNCSREDWKMGMMYTRIVNTFPGSSCTILKVFRPLQLFFFCVTTSEDLSTNLLGVAALCMLLLTSFPHFVIDFLSIRKVIIFSAIATDDRHPLRSLSLYQNAANCMTIRFRYITQPRGVRKTYCTRSRNDVRPLTSRSNAMPSKKTMEPLEDICRCKNCSKARLHVSR